MNTPTLLAPALSGLLTGTLLITLAMTASPAAAAPANDGPLCITPSPARQLVRAGAAHDVLLKDGQSHYRLHLQKRCISAADSHRFALTSRTADGRICSNAGAMLATDSGRCEITTIEAIDAATFKHLALRR